MRRRRKGNDAMRKFARLGALLLLTTLGSGCAKNMVLVTDTESLCKDWPPVLVEKGDRMTAKTAERIARLETRAIFIDKMLDQRSMIISAHSRRLADIEMHLRDHGHMVVTLTDRVARLESSQEITKEERMKRQHAYALLQWIMSIILGAGVIAGLFAQGEVSDLFGFLGGLISPQ